MKNVFDAIVIGLGAMGSSACCHLARRGLKVLGLDQHSLAHDRGSSHGETRLIPRLILKSPTMCRCSAGAFELWTQLEGQYGEALFERNGLVTFGRPGMSRVYDGALSSGRIYSIPMEKFSRDEAARRWPMYLAPEGFAAAYEPGAGVLHAERCVLAHAAEARRSYLFCARTRRLSNTA